MSAMLIPQNVRDLKFVSVEGHVRDKGALEIPYLRETLPQEQLSNITIH